jgi:uncharacterized protein
MELSIRFIEQFWILANAMSPYILGGLLIAGILKQSIPDHWIAHYLGGNQSGSVLKATLIGIPIPVCSCSVVPLAKSLQKEGAGRGAVQSFLISSPITGADSILATYSIFGWLFTLYRIITSILIAITTGLLQNLTDKDTPAPSQTTSQNHDTTTCCHGGCHKTRGPQESPGFSLKAAFRYAFVTLFGDIYQALLIGLIAGALFTTLFPREWLAPLFGSEFLAYFVVLIFAMPLYICATTSLPLAAGLVLSGMSGGAAFVLLTAGPATNTVTMGVVAQMFGKRGLAIYLGTISVMSIAFGAFFDRAFSDLEIMHFVQQTEEIGYPSIAASIIMLGLTGYYLLLGKR